MTCAFYAKCRPQGSDAAELALKHGRIFVGYPPFRKGWEGSPRDALLDISSSNFSPGDLDPTLCQIDGNRASYQAQVTKFRKFAREVTPGCVVAMPRPGELRCYIGRVTRPFELVWPPPWSREYVQLRQDKGLIKGRVGDLPPAERMSYLGNVAQTWSVEWWQPLPWPLLPGFIRSQLLARNQIGWIDDGLGAKSSAAGVLEELASGAYHFAFSPTTNGEVEDRLLRWVGDKAFEHLVCDLLQLESPGEHWWQMGGSGDGGIDIYGVGSDGSVVGAAQCKVRLEEDPVKLAQKTRHPFEEVGDAAKLRVYVATLSAPELGQGAGRGYNLDPDRNSTTADQAPG